MQLAPSHWQIWAQAASLLSCSLRLCGVSEHASAHSVPRSAAGSVHAGYMSTLSLYIYLWVMLQSIIPSNVSNLVLLVHQFCKNGLQLSPFQLLLGKFRSTLELPRPGSLSALLSTMCLWTTGAVSSCIPQSYHVWPTGHEWSE